LFERRRTKGNKDEHCLLRQSSSIFVQIKSLFERRRTTGNKDEHCLLRQSSSIFVQIKGTEGKGTKETTSGWESFAMLISSVGERKKKHGHKKAIVNCFSQTDVSPQFLIGTHVK
jgi:hypothetical protein